MSNLLCLVRPREVVEEVSNYSNRSVINLLSKRRKQWEGERESNDTQGGGAITAVTSSSSSSSGFNYN